MKLHQSRLRAKTRVAQTHGSAFSDRRAMELMTLAENIGMLLEEYTDLNPAEIREVAS